MGNGRPAIIRILTVSKFSLIALVVFLSTAAIAQNNPVPLINQPLNPASVAPGRNDFTLKVRGTGFAAGAVLKWNGSGRLTIVDSDKRLHATITAADVANAGTASITVVNPVPGGGTSNVAYFPIREPLSSVAFARNDYTLNASQGYAVVTGDFDNDGKLDLAVGQGSPSSPSLAVFRGLGDGTFDLSPLVTNTGFVPAGMIASDFNMDGNLDVAYSDGEHYEIVVLLGDGTGHFHKASRFDGAYSSLLLASADFNLDGNLDLFSAGGSRFDDGFLLSLGNGDGTFENPFPIYQQDNIGFAAVGDFDRDGILDLSVPDGQVQDIYLGNGDGSFRGPNYQDTVNGGAAATAVDVNGDGILDIVTDGVTVLLGKGDGNFTDIGGVATGLFSPYTFTGDFNGDAKTDIAIVARQTINNQYFQTVGLLLGNGDGTFQDPLFFTSGTSDSWLGDEFALGDFNNDGKLDLAVVHTPTTVPLLTVLLQTTANISPYSVDFGKQQINKKSSAQVVKIKNIGPSPLPLDDIQIKGADKDSFSETNHCGSQIASGATCSIKVFFTPTQTEMKSGLLKIYYGDIGSPQKVLLSGTGVNLKLSLKPSELDFPVQLVGTQSSPQTATLTNTGTETVTISQIAAKGPFTQTNNCPATLNPDASCQIHVRFEPTDPGNASGTLIITDDASNSPQKTALTGIGTIVKLSPISINFGDQAVGTTSPAVPVTLTNKGNVTLNISDIEITGANASDFAQANNCGNNLPAGGSCKIKVTFTPTAPGARAASLTITDDGGGSPQTVALSGTGT